MNYGQNVNGGTQQTVTVPTNGRFLESSILGNNMPFGSPQITG